MKNFLRVIQSIRNDKSARRQDRRRRCRLTDAEVCESRTLLAGTYSLIGDLRTDGNPSSEIDHGWIPETMVQVGPVTYFTATTAEAGHELWKTDGTVEGTLLVKDLIPGEYPRLPFQNRPNRLNGFLNAYPHISELTNVNGTLFFVADDGVDGLELWKSDGTDSGTVLVKELPVDEDQLNFAPKLTGHNGDVYFQAYEDDHGWEIWKSDGTPGGTGILKDIRPGTASSYASDFFSHGNSLYFTANDGSSGRELWISDGSSAGTTLLKDLTPGSQSSIAGEFNNLNGTLLFTADGALWTSDGTSGGTNALAAASIQPGETAVIGNTLYFPGHSSNAGTELWKTDGTPGGTIQIADIYPGAGGSRPSELTAVGGSVYFNARVKTGNYSTDYQLWKSDGTTGGTVLVKDISGGIDGPTELTNLNGQLVFSVNGSDVQLGFVGRELWTTDGTESGTVLLKDIHSGTADADPTALVNLNGTLLFVADDGVHGSELWKSDGTTSGTQLHKDVNDANASSWPVQLTSVNNRLTFVAQSGGANPYNDEPYLGFYGVDDNGGLVTLDDFDGESTVGVKEPTPIGQTLYFIADDDASGREVWKSDGTVAGTSVVKNIVPNHQENTGRHPRDLFDINGTLFFVIGEPSSGRELWKSDGTESGTVLVSDVRPGFYDSTPQYLTNVGGTLYFTAEDSSSNRELWKSDGTDAGTVLVKDIRASGSSTPFLLTNVNGTLFFSADDDTHGRELWKSDGTTNGTVLVSDLAGGGSSGLPAELQNVGGRLYFTALDGGSSRHFYTSDGTQAGTVQLIANIGGTSSSTVTTATLGQTVFLMVDAAGGRKDLWVSDGTLSGTTKLLADRDVLTGFTSHAGAVYFAADDGAGGISFYKSNGSTAAPQVLQTGLNDFGDITVDNGQLYFAAGTASHGTELWTSDGTPAGTVLFKDLNPGPGSSQPRRFLSHLGMLYFNAGDTAGVPRLWRTDGTPAATSPLSAAAGQPSAVDPASLTVAGNRLYFTASNNSLGRELFVVDEDATEPPSSAPTITSPGSSTQQLRPTISWNAVEHATEYEIWVKNQSTGENPFHQTTVATTSYTPDVDFGIGRFNLWIRAKNSLGNGPWTSQYNFTIDARASVNDPSRFLNTQRPTLTWPELPGAVKYDLWVDDKLGGVSQYVRNQNVIGTSWTPASDMPLGLYHAWIRGIAADGTSGGWSVTTIFYVMPSPTVTAGNNPTFDRTPTFAWDALPGAVKYELFIRNRNTGSTELYQQNITDLNFTVPSALADGPYRVWMLGVSDDNVRSFWTDPMDIFVGGRTDVLTPMGSTGDTTPEFTWRPVDGAVRYDLWVDQVGGQSQIIREQNLTATSYTPVSPLAAGNYRVWVRAISSTSETSDWSLQVDFTIAAAFILEDGLPVVHPPLIVPTASRPGSPLPTSRGEGQGEGAPPRVVSTHSQPEDNGTPEPPEQYATAKLNDVEHSSLMHLWSRQTEIANLLDGSECEKTTG